MKDNPIAAGDIKYSFFETSEDESKLIGKYLGETSSVLGHSSKH